MGQGPYVDRQRRSGGGRGPPPHATCRPLHRRRPWGRRWRGPRRPSRDRRGGPVGTPGEICARRRPPPAVGPSSPPPFLPPNHPPRASAMVGCVPRRRGSRRHWIKGPGGGRWSGGRVQPPPSLPPRGGSGSQRGLSHRRTHRRTHTLSLHPWPRRRRPPSPPRDRASGRGWRRRPWPATIGLYGIATYCMQSRLCFFFGKRLVRRPRRAAGPAGGRPALHRAPERGAPPGSPRATLFPSSTAGVAHAPPSPPHRPQRGGTVGWTSMSVHVFLYSTGQYSTTSTV